MIQELFPHPVQHSHIIIESPQYSHRIIESHQYSHRIIESHQYSYRIIASHQHSHRIIASYQQPQNQCKPQHSHISFPFPFPLTQSQSAEGSCSPLSVLQLPDQFSTVHYGYYYTHLYTIEWGGMFRGRGLEKEWGEEQS